MNKRKSIFISIGLALLALLLIVSYLKKREHELLKMSQPVSVLVATRDILKNSPVEEDMIAIMEVPQRFLQPGALRNPADAIGRLAQSPISKGEQILGTKLITYGTETGLAVKIPAGMRAVAINIDLVTSVGGLVKPDNFVDVLATFNFGDNDKDDYKTLAIMENVRVLAVDADLGVGIVEGKKGSADRKQSQRIATVTLAMDPQQAQDLVLAQHSGELYLSLRSVSETDQTYSLKPSDIEALTGIKGRTTQKPAAYRQYRGR